MEIPAWLSGQIDKDGVRRVTEAIAEAEKKTSAEIVPMVVHGSIATGHVFTILVLLHLLVLGALAPSAAARAPDVPVWAWELGIFLISLASAYAQKNIGWWKRVLTPAEDEVAAVIRRAQLEFYTAGITGTAGKTGVLIFVSVLERRAVVLTDQAILDFFPNDQSHETWKTTVQLLLEKTKAGDLAGGIADAIHEVAKVLGPKLPCSPHDHNELANVLILKD